MPLGASSLRACAAVACLHRVDVERMPLAASSPRAHAAVPASLCRAARRTSSAGRTDASAARISIRRCARPRHRSRRGVRPCRPIARRLRSSGVSHAAEDASSATEGWPSPVEGSGLENRQGRKALVGSNPTPSALRSVVALAAGPRERCRGASSCAGLSARRRGAGRGRGSPRCVFRLTHAVAKGATCRATNRRPSPKGRSASATSSC